MLPEYRAMNYSSSHKVSYNGNNIASKINNDDSNMANKNNVKDTASYQKKHFIIFICVSYYLSIHNTI